MALFFLGDRLTGLFLVLSLGEFVLSCDGGVPSCCRFRNADGSFISGSAKSCVPGVAVVSLGFPVVKVSRVGLRVGMLTWNTGLSGLSTESGWEEG